MPPRVREQQQLQMDSSSSNGVTSDFEEAEEDYDWDNRGGEEEDRSQYQVILFRSNAVLKQLDGISNWQPFSYNWIVAVTILVIRMSFNTFHVN